MSELRAFAVDAPPGLAPGRQAAELGVALAAALCVGLCVAVMGGWSPKFQVAAVIGAAGLCVTVLYPDRRIMLLALWIVVHPLSVEKVFPTGTSIGPEFSDQPIVVSASDLLLAALAASLVAQWQSSGRRTLVWSPAATVWTVMAAWGAASYALHAAYLQDGLTSTAPLTLLHYARMLAFIVIVPSAIRSRGDLIVVGLAMAAAVAFESAIVMLAHVSGHPFNFTRLLGPDKNLDLMTFSSGDASVQRATGTVGHINQQAAFHVFFTVPLLAMLALRNGIVRWGALAVMAASVVAVVLTYSRGAWLASAVAFAVVFGLSLQRRLISKAAWLTGALMGLAAVVLLAAFSQSIVQRLTVGDDGATDSRLRMVALAYDLFQSHPLIGVGPGEFAEAGYRIEPTEYEAPEWVAPGRDPVVPTIGRIEVARAVLRDGTSFSAPLPVHNRYLLALTELGVPGLVLWLALFAVFLRSAWRCAAAPDPFYRSLGIAGIGTLVAALFYMMLDLFSDDKSTQILVFSALVVTAASRHVSEAPRDAPRV